MPVNILQITDTHIHDTDVRDFYGSRPNQALNHVIQHALTHIPKIDYVVVTGDLSHDGGEASARHLKHSLQQFDCPIYVTPGNHDDAQIIKNYLLADQITMPQHIQLEHWQLLFVDSHLDDQVYGQISDHALLQLNRQLTQNTKPALLFTHHPPTSIGCDWLDNIGINNGDQLLSQMCAYPQLKAVVFGHIHQQFELQWENLLLLGSPSTCIQFKPNSGCFATDDEAPGYRLFTLNAQGTFTSQVVRCPE
ncbi:MAG: metallophosphoesterase [Gammaproteobacteria bacterium]